MPSTRHVNPSLMLASQGPLRIVRLFLHNSSGNRDKNCCSLSQRPVFGHSFLESGLNSRFQLPISDCRLPILVLLILAITPSLGIALRCVPGVTLGSRRSRNPLLQPTLAAGESPALPAKSDSKMRGRGRDDAYIYSDWNAPDITCLFLLLEKREHTMLTIRKFVCALADITALLLLR
jgi:hypothetical protein